MTYKTRLEILRELPVSATVYRDSPVFRPYIKLGDFRTKMLVMDIDQKKKLSIRYHKLTCDTIIQAEQVRKKLAGEKDNHWMDAYLKAAYDESIKRFKSSRVGK